jgi:hypothetical protein
MVYTRSDGVAQRNGGLSGPAAVKNYRFHSQATLHDWTLDDQARRAQEWSKDLTVGKRQRAGLTVGDIDGACPLQWDVNIPGVRERAKAQGRGLTHLEQPPAKRLPDHHQAARTARGGWTAKDAIDAQDRGLLVEPTDCLPPPHWEPTVPEGGLRSNAVIKQQFKYHMRDRTRVPDASLGLGSGDPTIQPTRFKGGSTSKPSIRTRDLGSMVLSEDTKGPGNDAHGYQGQNEAGIGTRQNETQRANARREPKHGRRARRQPSVARRLREMEETNSAQAHNDWVYGSGDDVDGAWLGRGPPPRDTRIETHGTQPAGVRVLTPLSRTAMMYSVENGGGI